VKLELENLGHNKRHRHRGDWINYFKRKVGDVTEPIPFMGWDKLLSVIDACEQVPYEDYYRNYCIERDKAFVSALFLTGGRAEEVCRLERKNFDFDSFSDYVVVKGMLNQKRFLVLGDDIIERDTRPKPGAHSKYWKAERKKGKTVYVRRVLITDITSDKAKELRIRKQFPILKSEPLVPILEKWVNQESDITDLWATRRHSDVLFNSPKHKYMTAMNGWYIIRRLQEITKIEMWPHLFRSQRASQLYYEYGLRWEELKRWFSWESIAMADLYTKTSPETLVEIIKRRRKEVAMTD